MEIATPTEAIRNRMEALHLRHAIVFPDHTPSKGTLIGDTAKEIAERLEQGDELAVIYVKTLVDHSDQMPNSAFWGTPLGRLLFVVGGYGEELIPQATVARLLGCSRQWVNELVARGDLEVFRSASPPQVFVAHVRELVKAKLDKNVN